MQAVSKHFGETEKNLAGFRPLAQVVDLSEQERERAAFFQASRELGLERTARRQAAEPVAVGEQAEVTREGTLLRREVTDQRADPDVRDE